MPIAFSPRAATDLLEEDSLNDELVARALSASDGEADGPPADRGDRLAVALYRFLEARSDVDLLHVATVAAAASHSLSVSWGGASTSEAERVRLSLSSLRACMAELLRTPSRREYDRWRRQQAAPREFASSTFIRDTFNNSWPQALAAVSGAGPDVTARRLLRGGKAFTDKQRARALMLFAAAVAHGERTQHNYARWARAYVLEPGALDVPLSTHGYMKHSGQSWFDVLVSAGLPDERAHRRCHGGRRGSPMDYTPDRILECLRRAASELDLRAPGTIAYDKWAVRVSGDPNSTEWQPIPRSRAIASRFGGWGRALHAAGLIGDAEVALYRHHSKMAMTEDRLLQFLAAAMRDRGVHIGRGAYRQWRWAVLRHPAWTHGRIPSDIAIWSHFDEDWDLAKARTEGISAAPELAPHLHRPPTAPADSSDER